MACNPKKHDDRSIWHIDDNKYPRCNLYTILISTYILDNKLFISIFIVANVSYKIFELSFFQRFLESHEKMLTGNSAFKPKISDFNSRPWMWPLNLRVCLNYVFYVLTWDPIFNNLFLGSILFCRATGCLPIG